MKRIIGYFLILSMLILLAGGATALATDLIDAARRGDINAVKELLNEGADVNTKDRADRTALNYAASGGYAEMAKALIEKGANVNTKDSNGDTALMKAAFKGQFKGHREIVKTLIANGADVNAKANNGWTALTAAAEKGSTEVVRLLIEKGADVNAKGRDDRTALNFAASGGYTEIALLLEDAMKDKYIAAQKSPPLQKSPPTIDIVSISLYEPSQNNILDAGEKGTIFIKAKNTGKCMAFGVSAGLEGEAVKGMSFAKKTSIGDIKPDEEKTVSIDISADEDILTKDVKLKATLIESGGFDSQPVILSFKTGMLIPPVLQIAKVDIEDS
ncbi:MAG: ankyrin repeat domain-containing protein [Nitrospirae bacterium]|nr:ankyrin repeat domain-containing protein [Nitrospirota bacterium]